MRVVFFPSRNFVGEVASLAGRVPERDGVRGGDRELLRAVDRRRTLREIAPELPGRLPLVVSVRIGGVR